MTLPDRLLLFSTAQLVMCGAVFALAYGTFERSVVPTFDALLRNKTERIVQLVGTELAVPLGADDPALLARTVADVVNDPDFACAVVRDAQGKTVFARAFVTPIRAMMVSSREGIPEANRDRIFDAFFTTKEVGRGTGQGLAISRAIVVDRHGGTLTFESTVGASTTFYVRLPIAGPPPHVRSVAD